MQATGPCGQSYVKACEPEDNPTHAQGHMGRLFNREPGEVGRKATKRKGPDYNRAPPSSLRNTIEKYPKSRVKKNGNTKTVGISRAGKVSVYIETVRLRELKLPSDICIEIP